MCYWSRALLIEDIEAELPQDILSSDALWAAGEGRSRMMEETEPAAERPDKRIA